MIMIFLGTGHCHLGCTERDKDGNITKEEPAHFEFAEGGPCVAIGTVDLESRTVDDAFTITDIFGDWDAAGYLARVLEQLKPARPVNIPDFAAIIQAAIKDGVNICDYCQGLNCRDCAVTEWKENEE